MQASRLPDRRHGVASWGGSTHRSFHTETPEDEDVPQDCREHVHGGQPHPGRVRDPLVRRLVVEQANRGRCGHHGDHKDVHEEHDARGVPDANEQGRNASTSATTVAEIPVRISKLNPEKLICTGINPSTYARCIMTSRRTRKPWTPTRIASGMPVARRRPSSDVPTAIEIATTPATITSIVGGRVEKLRNPDAARPYVTASHAAAARAASAVGRIAPPVEPGGWAVTRWTANTNAAARRSASPTKLETSGREALTMDGTGSRFADD